MTGMLAIRNIIKIYPGPLTALDGINLTIRSGIYGLLGPNGAGKSTLMKIIAGLLEPTSGEVYWDDIEITSRPREIWRRLGYLPQEFGFYPHLSGRAMLKYLLELKGFRTASGLKTLVAELLERVNLKDAADRKIKTYSGGMRQRLGIAQAIAGNPPLLIVDEPTAGLDPEERRRFYGLLAEIAEDRVVVLSTHIVEDVAILCPQFALLRNGRLIAQMSPSAAREILNGHLFEGRIKREDLPAMIRSHTMTQSVLSEGVFRVRIYDPDHHPPDGFSQSEPTLEDAYIVLMKNGSLKP